MEARYQPKQTLRPLIESGILIAVVLLFAATWQVRSFVVVGPSMAETLVGEHRRLTCKACGFDFCCAANATEMPGRRGVCPNCGDARQRLDLISRHAADAVLVDRSAFLPRGPRRWELTAFRGPEHASQVFVKRIVGLPGETIELRHGDVFANGGIQRKSLAQLRALAVPVYDSRHEPDSRRSRWLPDAAASGWRKAGSRYSHAAAGAPQPAIDWLVYRHQRGGATASAEECAVFDTMGYNQDVPVTESYAVRDLLVCCQMEIADSSAASWSITDGVSQFLVELDFARGEVRVSQDGGLLGGGGWSLSQARSVRFELALCDQQVLVAIDQRPILSLPYQPPDVPFRPTPRPVAVGTRGGALELSDLRLFRDVYYRPPRGRPAGRQVRLAGDEYFVLGDNSAVSLDSRDWSRAGIKAESFVGKPVLAYPSGMGSDDGEPQFKVPPLSRFRYIQ